MAASARLDTATRELTVNYSLGGTSGDVRQHSIECMRVVGERFSFLSPSDITGLYHCFFLFAGAARLEAAPLRRTEFLRDVHARHAANPDFLSALGWASIEKLQHPADGESTKPPVVDAKVPSGRWLVKELAKKILSPFPRVYLVAQRLFWSLRKR